MPPTQAKTKMKKQLHDIISGKSEMSLSKPGLFPVMYLEANAHYKNLKGDARCQQATPLLAAVLGGHLVLVKYLVEEGADVEKGTFDGLRPLSCALVKRSFDIASFLIASGADVKSIDNEGRYPMFFAIQNDSPVSIVKDLISAGADKDAVVQQMTNLRPITKAVMESNVPVVKFLLEQSVDLNYPVKGDANATLLFVAIALTNHFEVAKLLIDHGADIEGQADEFLAPLLSAIQPVADVRCLRLLVEAGANVNRLFCIHDNPIALLFASTEKSLTALQFAALCGNYDAVKILLHYGANVNALAPTTKKTALHLICLRNLSEMEGRFRKPLVQIINSLISHGADLSIKDASNCSPARCCFHSNNCIALEQFIKAGADVNERHGEEGSILTYAIIHSNAELVKLCLQYGGDGSYKFKGKCAYQMAFDKNHIDLVRMFFKYHPADDLKTTKVLPAMYENQLTFFDGLKNNDENAVKQSLHNGAEAKAFLKEMRHPIFLPVLNQNLAILKLLLNQGVFPNVHNQNKETPLHLACQQGFLAGCFQLLSHGACYNSKSSHGQTPLAVAESSPTRNQEIVDLLKTVRRLFRLARKGLLVFEHFEMLPDEVFCSNMNCVNRNGNTLMQETICYGSFRVAKSIMNRRLRCDISFAR